jgi:cation transport ATPase
VLGANGSLNGITMAAAIWVGAAAAGEAADAVLLVDQLVPAIEIARRAKFSALESVYAGIGGSRPSPWMVAAAMGYLSLVQSARLQELLDITVILNALRVLRDPPRSAGTWTRRESVSKVAAHCRS